MKKIREQNIEYSNYKAKNDDSKRNSFDNESKSSRSLRYDEDKWQLSAKDRPITVQDLDHNKN